MRRIALFMALAVAVPLSACQTLSPTESPAPLAATKIDENARITADKAFDVALDGINLLMDMKVRLPGRADDDQPFIAGTSAAKKLAAAVRTVDKALDAAASFAEAGNASSYQAALNEARAGIAQLQSLLKR